MNKDVDKVNKIAEELNLGMVQLHGDESPEYCNQMIKPVIKVFRVNNKFDSIMLNNYQVATFLFDTYNKENHGGTGESFDWQSILQLNTEIPIILSGGEGKTKINAANLISEYFAYDFYLLDIKSKSTFQMAKNLKDLIEYSDGPILLATNPLHHKRTILTLKKQDFDVLIPDNYIKNAQDDYSIIPSIRGFNSFNKIIYEFMGMAWYYLTGKIYLIDLSS